jgi:alginate O-acetyltransferase complex protein AlgI
MAFTSIAFALFLFILFFLYWLAFDKKLYFQNIFLVFCSYLFYGWWDWRFLFLLFIISVFNYFIGIGLHEKNKKKFRKILFLVGLLINLSTLIFFKYFNFFIDGFVNIFSLLGYNIYSPTLNIILPLGISFYIFFSISYITDVYQFKINPVRNFFDVLLTFSFFPIISAGPIQRPANLLPQIQKKRIFNYNTATDSLRQILWGLFMKIVVADNCAASVNTIFADFTVYNGSTLIIGIFLFTVQIYADFAGYSNIAIGIGKLLGFNIMQNFAYPYFSKDIREFWRKWNISLTTWFRDYVFLPLAYSLTRKIKIKKILFIKSDLLIYIISISVTWFLSGLWHGANYTFIVWGGIHGFLLVINRLNEKPRRKFLKYIKINNKNVFLKTLDFLLTFILIMLSWIFFRSENIGFAVEYILKMFSNSVFSVPQIIPKTTIFCVIVFFFIEWLGRHNEYAFASFVLKFPVPVRWIFYYLIIFSIFFFSGSNQQFIYSQF